MGSVGALAQPPEQDASDAPEWYEREGSAERRDTTDEREAPPAPRLAARPEPVLPEPSDEEGGEPRLVVTSAPSDTSAPSAAAADVGPDDDGFRSGFFFGSYGRVSAASNLRGGLGRNANITAFHPRIDEDLYFEIELRRQDRFAEDVRSTVVATLAFGGEFFHLNGDFNENVAVRNLYAEVQNALVSNLSLWAGSRMWRGDDIYLLNFWPLDNLNMIGGGLDYRALDEKLDFRLAVGLARPDDPFHRQVTGVVANAGFLPHDVVILDRPRITAAAKATFFPFGRRVRTGAKVLVYGEGHFLPRGERELEFGLREIMPYDSGMVVGAQLGGWQVSNRAFVNLFFRHARGLGAYNPLGVPFRTGGVQTTERARETIVGLSGNYELGAFGLQLGAYYRYFRDADPNIFDRSALAEGAVNVRPHVWIGERAGLSLDLAYQALQMSALDERTGRVVRGGVTKIGFIPFYSPFGRGTFTRPHLRLIYSMSIRDQGAQALYPMEDPRSRTAVEHFLGVGAEWWFDSTSYGF